MKRFHFLPFLIPEGVTYEMETLIGSRPNYANTQKSLNDYIDYMKWKWYRRFPFRMVEPWISWEIYADDTRTRYFFWAPNLQWGNEFWNRLYTWSPELNFTLAEPPKMDFSLPHAGMKLQLERDFTVPMRIYEKNTIDTQSALLEFLSNVEEGEQVGLQFLIRPIFHHQTAKAFQRAIREVSRDKTATRKETEMYLNAIKTKSAQAQAEVSIRIAATAQTYERAFELTDQTARTLSYMNSKELNRFESREWWQIVRPMFRYEWNKRIFSFRKPENKVVLGTPELAGLTRLPSIAGTTKFIKIKGRRVLIPVEVRNLANRPDPTILVGHNNRNINKAPVYLPVEDLKNHVSIVGGPKTGKSTLIVNMLSDFLKLKTEENKHGLTLIDTQGTLSDQLLEQVPPKWHHLVRVVRFRTRTPFNPFDMDFPASDNRKANLISEIIRRVTGSWNPMMQEIFLVSSLALLKVGMATLENLLKVIEDEEFCKRIICLLDENDPEQATLIRSLMRNLRDTKRIDWRKEFVLSSTLARFRGMLLSYSGVLMNKKSNYIKWREALDEGHIVILDISACPAYERTFFGTACAVLFRQAMVTRSKEFGAGEHMPLHPFIVDDASLYMNSALDNIEFVLNEARKYNVPFILANSALTSQIQDKDIGTLFRNFGTIFAFQQGSPSDAQVAVDNMLLYGLSHRDFNLVEKHVAYIQMIVDNVKMRTFSMNIRKPPNPVHDKPADDMVKEHFDKAAEIEEKVAKEKENQRKKNWQDIEEKVKLLEQKLKNMEPYSSEEEEDDFIDIFYED
ncbi:hypothetical protein MK805_12325 [Shimazuella sp. AN120528]|uniref:hypothetical protein n=1 Tax=Shimazuella soli TaxID=1892854 RepID=UPI001F108CDE|nr:hypothetical protein [Shimazuella soli]MCH5585732.1 hypothetical protein [Shimazuella soli]